MNIKQIATASTAVDLVEIENGKPVTTSLKVAELFGKRHADVLRSIEQQVVPTVSALFGKRNFALSSYRNEQNKRQPMYILTRDAFTMVVMGYTGSAAMQFKEAYIAEFNRKEEALRGTPLTNDELVDRAAQKVVSQLFPQFVKTITPTLAKSIVEQIRSLPQGETLLPLPVEPVAPIVPLVQAPPKTTTKKRGKKIMMYTLHTWEIEHTAAGPVAINKKEFETADHAALMKRLHALVGTGIQSVVNRKRVPA